MVDSVKKKEKLIVVPREKKKTSFFCGINNSLSLERNETIFK